MQCRMQRSDFENAESLGLWGSVANLPLEFVSCIDECKHELAVLEDAIVAGGLGEVGLREIDASSLCSTVIIWRKFSTHRGVFYHGRFDPRESNEKGLLVSDPFGRGSLLVSDKLGRLC